LRRGSPSCSCFSNLLAPCESVHFLIYPSNRNWSRMNRGATIIICNNQMPSLGSSNKEQLVGSTMRKEKKKTIDGTMKTKPTTKPHPANVIRIWAKSSSTTNAKPAAKVFDDRWDFSAEGEATPPCCPKRVAASLSRWNDLRDDSPLSPPTRKNERMDSLPADQHWSSGLIYHQSVRHQVLHRNDLGQQKKVRLHRKSASVG